MEEMEQKKKGEKNRKMKKKERERVSRVRYMRLFSQCVRRRVCVRVVISVAVARLALSLLQILIVKK